MTTYWPNHIFFLLAATVVNVQNAGVYNRKISMIFPLVSCCSCVNNPSSS